MSVLLILIAFGIIGGYVYYDRSRFENSMYKLESGNSYLKTRLDKGNYGEYLSFNKLESIQGKHKILTNVYLPKEDGETTEIDLIYIHETGIYVIESKNYSGWIFGNENSRYWMQTFEKGRKERLYNPIWQNSTHIKNLARFLKTIDLKHFKSIIVFSERCTLKKIEVMSNHIKVVNRYDLVKAVTTFIQSSDNVLSETLINDLYNSLKPYTNVSAELKASHVHNIETLKSKHQKG